MFGFTGSSESKFTAIQLAGFLDLPPNSPLVFVRGGFLLPSSCLAATELRCRSVSLGWAGP